jgi:hypothetical protein
MMPGLIGDDGYDYNAMTAVFDTCRTSRHLREIYIDQCVAVINVIRTIRAARQAESSRP